MGNEIKLYAYVISTLNSAEWLASSTEKKGPTIGTQNCSGLGCEKTHASIPTTFKH
jgi:hypothetical protein